MMSGGRYSGFREGWALHMWGCNKAAHYFIRDGAGFALASCNGFEVGAGQLFHIGSWRACKRCVAKFGEPPAHEREQGFAAMEALLRQAQGIEAGTDETLQAAQPEGREPGSEGMRPRSIT